MPSHLVKCVVIDEAHKALGKHSYCEVRKDLEIYELVMYELHKTDKIYNF